MKLLAVFIIIFVLASYLQAGIQKEKMSLVYKVMRLTHFVGVYADFYCTRELISSGRGEELNPIGSLYMGKPPWDFVVVTSFNLLCDYLFVDLYKKNKTIAHITAVVLLVARTYVIYRGIKFLNM